MTQEQFIDDFLKHTKKKDPLDNIFEAIFSEPDFSTVYVDEKYLRTMKTREAKAGETLRASFIGSIWLPYGDENYYILDSGEIITEYFSIGD
jgi:hypothetical protein